MQTAPQEPSESSGMSDLKELDVEDDGQRVLKIREHVRSILKKIPLRTPSSDHQGALSRCFPKRPAFREGYRMAHPG